MPVIEYGEEEIEYLKKKDKKLGAFIERRGPLHCLTFPDIFAALVSSIVTQQISSAAAESIDRRIRKKFGRITPRKFKDVKPDELRECGLSIKKAEYILGLAELVRNGELDLRELEHLSDKEVAEKLLPVKGIGRWTVEMILMFTLGRQDVVSYGDLAIRRGVMNLYGLKELTKEQFERYSKRWSPYGTIASLYLWEAAVDDELAAKQKARSAKNTPVRKAAKKSKTTKPRKGSALMRGADR
jgi:DNA-3-methyladenine glycosylase II